MNELKNLLLWYGVDDDGVPNRLTQLMAIPAKYDIESYFEQWRKGKEGVRAENVYTWKKEYIVVPLHLGGIEGMGYHFLWGKDQLLRVVLPYFVTIKEDIDVLA